MNQQLFTPFSIGSLTLRNRFVRSATQDWLGNPDGTVSQAEIDLHRDLAKGGVGLIISAHSYVQHPLGRASLNQNGCHDDRFIDGYRRLTEAVHQEGAAIILQLAHAGRQTLPELTEHQTPAGPSAVPEPGLGFTPRPLSEEEILSIIDSFEAAALRAKAAGFDGVQLHAAHGYLLAQFLSPYTNRRTDAWGGNLENRSRILRETIARVRHAVGEDFPVLIKLNATDGMPGEGHLSLEDVVETARVIEQLGISAIEVSGGMREAGRVSSAPGIDRPEKEAYFREAARLIRSAVRIPIILVGGLRSVVVMNDIIESGVADLISLSRPFIKEPDLVRRLEQTGGNVSCVSCNGCFKQDGIRCVLNQ